MEAALEDRMVSHLEEDQEEDPEWDQEQDQRRFRMWAIRSMVKISQVLHHLLQAEEGVAAGIPVGIPVFEVGGFIVQFGGATLGGTVKVPLGTCGIGGTPGTLPE